MAASKIDMSESQGAIDNYKYHSLYNLTMYIDMFRMYMQHNEAYSNESSYSTKYA